MSLTCKECDKDIRHPFYSILLLKVDKREKKGYLSRLEYALCSSHFEKINQKEKSLEEIESELYLVQEATGNEEFGGVVQWLGGFTGKGNYVYLERTDAHEYFPKSVEGLSSLGEWHYDTQPYFHPAQVIMFDLPHDPKEWQERVAEAYQLAKKCIQYGIEIRRDAVQH